MDGADELAMEEAGWTAMGQQLRRLRTMRGWRQEDLARESGVSVATIRAIENHPLGRRHAVRVLSRLSHALGKPDNHLNDYRKDPRAAALESEPAVVEPGGEPGVVEAGSESTVVRAASRRSDLDLLVPRLDAIIVARLREMVVPRLESMETEMRGLADIIHNTGRDIAIDIEHPGSTE